MGASGTVDEAPGMKFGRLGLVVPDLQGMQDFYTRLPAALVD